ncbi:MAG: hypothetical protein AAF317_01510 [Pseudomonadota bacterium]
MKPYPPFADRDIPQDLTLASFRLRWLTPADVEQDYIAVMESEAELMAEFGRTWPKGLTLEDNRLDLAWHQREFEAKRSYAWIIEDAGTGAYLGCAYVYPDWSPTGPMEAWWWFRTSVAETVDRAAFRQIFLDWLGGPPWPSLPIMVEQTG